MESEEYITLHFINPVTQKNDVVSVKKKDLDELRKYGLAGISFFHTALNESFIINLYIDQKNNVRSANKSGFFLKANGKLFK